MPDVGQTANDVDSKSYRLVAELTGNGREWRALLQLLNDLVCARFDCLVVLRPIHRYLPAPAGLECVVRIETPLEIVESECHPTPLATP